jgi:4'-phosphopantetheinyl transferase EntD
MLIFRLSQELISDELEQWNNLQKMTLGEGVHPDRALSYCLSRDALRACLRENGVDLKIPHLIVTDHHKISIAEDYTLSISHTKNWGAAVIGSRLKYLGLGIDVELKDRAIKSAVLDRILHSKDQAFEPLTIWCLKEAIFKTLMNAQKITHPVEFSTIQVTTKGWTHADSKSKGDYQMVDHPKLVIALAWIKI